MRFFLLCYVLTSTTSICLSETIEVPADYTSIQDAIDAASIKDIVLVGPGVYNENLNFHGKAIKVLSSNGASNTIIDGGNNKSVVTFSNNEDCDSIIEGFTLQNGAGNIVQNTNIGGGICCYYSSPTICDNIIINNKANWGGGICCYGNNENPVIDSCIIENNISTKTINGGAGSGGGIHCQLSSPTIVNCNIFDNKCDYRGGGIGAGGICSPIIRNNTINSNKTVGNSGFGGGFGSSNAVSPIIDGNLIMNNCSRNGGGVCVWSGEVKNNVIINNIAKYDSGLYILGSGGGISALSNDPIVDRNMIVNNTAMNAGGGVSWVAAYGRCTNNLISSNVVGGNTEPSLNVTGGGVSIWMYSGGNAKFINNIIVNNNSEEYGGAIYISDTSVVNLVNCTVTNNSANLLGSGLYCEDNSSIKIVNSIIWGNSGDVISCGLNMPTITYSDVQGGWAGVGNLNVDPWYVDNSDQDYHLKYLSPCRNAGDNLALNLPSKDIEGNPRVAFGQVDMGADEFYNHLYYTGDATPSGYVKLKFIGTPGTSVNGLLYGLGKLDRPLPCDYGLWYLSDPVFYMMGLGNIPSDGVFVIDDNLPYNPPGPYSVYLQAAIDSQLTGLCTLNVE